MVVDSGNYYFVASGQTTKVPLSSTGNPAGTSQCNSSSSPDGRMAIFDRADQLWVVNTDGSGLHQIADMPGRNRCVAW